MRYSAKYSLTSAVITLDGTLTFNAVNMYGILFGNLSFKNTVLLSAAYDFIKSSENGFSSVRPRYAFILIDAIHIRVTTIIFAAVLLTEASELTSFVDCSFANDRFNDSRKVRQDIFGSSLCCRNNECEYFPNCYDKKNPYYRHKIFLIGKLFYSFHLYHLHANYTPSKLFLTFATSSVSSGVLFISIVLGRGRFISTTAESLPGCGERTHTLSDRKTDSWIL